MGGGRCLSFANLQCCDPQCDVLVEEFEDVIEDWYRNHQEKDLTEFLCANHVLKGKDTSEYERESLLFSPYGGGEDGEEIEGAVGSCPGSFSVK
jgi:hypothetical protein